jgi:hypothetical protein
MQEKILLKSYDVQPFINQDEYISFELYSTVKNIKENFLNNNFDLNLQYSVERNSSRKFFVYGKLYSKNVDVSKVNITFKTSNNDTLYSPDVKNNLIGNNKKSIKVMPTQLTAEESISRNIFDKKVCSYFVQFEIKNDINKKTNNLMIQITGNSFSVVGTPLTSVTESYNPVNNVYEVPLVIYDDEGNFVPYGTNDTVFDENLNIVDENNDYPFLYDYHFIRQDFDIVDDNNIFFPFKTELKPDGTVVYDNSTQITDANNFPKFNLLMDYPSFFGLEKAQLGAKKITGIKEGQYVLPFNLYKPNLFFQNSPWKGAPATMAQWNVFGYAVKERLRNITASDKTYGVQPIYNTPQQFYDKINQYVLSFFKGCNLDVRNPATITNDYFLRAFLNYNAFQNKKNVNDTITSEFIDNLREGGGDYFDTIDVSFGVNEDKKLFEVDLTKTTLSQLNERLEIDVLKKENVEVKFPNSLIVNIVAENKNPTVSFDTNYQSVEAFNQDIDVVVKLDKKYAGANNLTLTLSAMTNMSTAVSLDQAKAADANYLLTSQFYPDSTPLKHDYQIIQDTAQIKYGDDSATFKVRIYKSNNYFIPKELNLTVIKNTDELIINQAENILTIDINPSIITSWTKYEFPGDNLIGIGIFKTNQSISNNSEIFKFQLQNSNINEFYKEKSFTSDLSYTLECINRGEATIYYDGEYGGGEKEVKPNEVVFSNDINEEFKFMEFILPANKNLISFTDRNNKTRVKYRNSKYEFRLKNISPAVAGSNNDSDTYNDVIIDAQELSSLDVALSNQSSEAWRTILRLNNFFQTGTVSKRIFTSNVYELIKSDLSLEQISQVEPDKGIFRASFGYPDFITNPFQQAVGLSNPAGLSSIAYIVRRNIYALRTKVNNVYYPRPKFTDFNNIPTVISLDKLNDNNSDMGIIKGSTEMFGTVILNKTMSNSNGTNVEYRKFTNRVDLIGLSVPSQTTFNYFTPENGAESSVFLRKYFNFDYRILRDSKQNASPGTAPVFIFFPLKVNFVTGNNTADKENSALSIARNGAPQNIFPINLPSPRFDDIEWITYIKQGNPDFNPLREVKFSPASQLNVNNFSNIIDGTKLLPVYTTNLYRENNQITF